MANDSRFFRLEHDGLVKNLPYNVAAEVCGVTIKTIAKWDSNAQTPHPSAITLLKMYAFGQLPLLNKSRWKGFRFKQNGYGPNADIPVLVTPYDEEITDRDIDCIPYKRQLEETLIRQNNKLKEEIKQLKERPEPTCEVIAFAPHLRRKEYDGIGPRRA